MGKQHHVKNLEQVHFVLKTRHNTDRQGNNDVQKITFISCCDDSSDFFS